ncbi:MULTISPECIES: class I SAM-dependent methyltransferase [Rhodobacterales]|uniref:class I SAM-dependent methyltransferase n=1 Tax=Roseobacter sp. N2S TaxID=2663844 RepID=UPI0028669C0A|nr:MULTISPECIES: class I SAM-dependent methyltransferase [Rhodobacterales]MDR6266700.1 D-mycarose 3-C-methyltransferase [Roseobacter sp. N2S]
MNSTLETCRTCQSSDLTLFLPMGNHPPANMFVRPEERDKDQPAYPLNTQACLNCGLIQVADQIPADFFRHYLYVPSGAATMHTHFAELAQVLEKRAQGGLIVDIGCNDGLMLSAANKQGSKTLGIDPAANLAELAKANGVDVHVAYFNPQTAQEVLEKHGPAQVISTTNTFNHIGDLHTFMTGVKILMADKGTFVIEVPWAKAIVETNEFDNVYHEHVSEMSLLSVVKLGAFFDLEVVDVHKLAVHGGSMRVFMRHASANEEPSQIVGQMLAEETAAGLTKQATYDDFAARVEKMREELLAQLSHMKKSGLKIAGYGAPAKGNTLLNYFQIGTDTLDFLVDRNPLKQGLYSPGMKIPIYGTEAIEREKPDVLLVLAWNFFDEIYEQQAAFRANGGKFLVPLPTPRLVS